MSDKIVLVPVIRISKKSKQIGRDVADAVKAGEKPATIGKRLAVAIRRK